MNFLTYKNDHVGKDIYLCYYEKPKTSVNQKYIIYPEKNKQSKLLIDVVILQDTVNTLICGVSETRKTTHNVDIKGFILLPNYIRQYLSIAFNEIIIIEEFKPLKIFTDKIKPRISIINIYPKPSKDTKILNIDSSELFKNIISNIQPIQNINTLELHIIPYKSYKILIKFIITLSSNDNLEKYLFPFNCLELDSDDDLFLTNLEYIAIKKGDNIQSFINPQQLGIGGLKSECQSLFRRAFSLRLADPKLIKNLGVSPPKGVILHGPPGCGKTLIARKIAQMIGVKEPKIINGPEIFSKFVGDSEAKIREIFKEAIDDYKNYKNESPLHVIIFDEFDSIGKSRHSGGDSVSSNVQSNLVNQLLSIMDGVNQIDNILVIGLTNRLDLIDSALIRPGRFEIHLNIGLPDENDRLEILQIHLRTMVSNNLVSEELKDVNILKGIAQQTNNYTGAEIAGLIKSAVSNSIERHTNLKNLNGNTGYSEPISVIEINLDDIHKGLNDIVPYFGQHKKDIDRILGKQFIFNFNHTKNCMSIINNSNSKINKYLTTSDNTSLKLLYIGENKIGKTTLIAKIAEMSKINHLIYLSNYDLIGLDNYKKSTKLRDIFQDSQLVDSSLIIIDDLDQILEIYRDENTNHIIFSNNMFQICKSIFSRLVEKKIIFLVSITQGNDLLQIQKLFDEIYLL